MLLAVSAWATPAVRGNDTRNDALSIIDDTDSGIPPGFGLDLYLKVVINLQDTGRLAHFSEHEGSLWASTSTLRRLGFKLPADTPSPVQLSSLAGVTAAYDRAHQEVLIRAPPSLLKLQLSVLHTSESPRPKASASPGLLFNYNLFGTRAEGDNGSMSVFTEFRAFNAHGVFSNTALTRSILTRGDWHTRSVRLDTTWSTSFPDRMITVNVGDILTGATSWSRATRIGGIQIGTNFGLQPYEVTTPLPAFFGTAVLPSQVQLYINGMKRYNGEVPAGPFQLDAVPGIHGAGNAQVVLTDALGRVTTLNFSLYGTQQLLRRGLTDWSTELGFVRRNYGLKSFSYGSEPMVSGTWRHGFSNHFTGAAHIEASNGLFDAGLGGDWLLGTAGVVSASAARSTRHGQSGSQLSLGYRWSGRIFHVAVDGTRASSGYRDAAALYSGPPPSLSASAQAGVSTPELGSFGLGYTHLDYLYQTSRYASLYWFKSLGRGASVNLSVNQNLGQSRDRSFFLTFSLPLDMRTYASAGLQHDGNGNQVTMNVMRSIPSQGGLGWRAQVRQGGGMHDGLAELDYLGRYGRVQAGVNDVSGGTYAYAGATGALVWMGGGLFPSRHIYNGFAVVSTDGVPNVPVKLENNRVGTTDRHGLLLVTPLNAYQNNKISIDPMDLPADMRIGRVNQNATPTDRAGVLVHFDISPVRAASIILHDAAGKPLPLGSEVRVHGQHGKAALVGFGGEVYLDTLKAHNALDVTLPDNATCHLAFDYRQQDGTIPRIGPLTCIPETQP